MGFRYDMQGKSPQSQAIVRKRDEEDRIRNQEYKRNKVDKSVYSEPLNETDYCTVWNRVTVDIENDGVAAIELITVKEFNREEIRFTYYKKEADGKLRFIPRPLDVTAADLDKLLVKARKGNIIR